MGAGERPHGREPAVLAGCTKSSGRREKMLSPFPRRPDLAHDQAYEPNEKASGKAAFCFSASGQAGRGCGRRPGGGGARSERTRATRTGASPGGGAEGVDGGTSQPRSLAGGQASRKG
jgi:hypothetical protein